LNVKNTVTKKQEEAFSFLKDNFLLQFLLRLKTDIIKKINVNTLITTGEHDIRSTPEMARNLNKVIKNSRFVEIKNGKHLCSIECADDVNMTFKEFIDENNAQT